ncbi:MAG TPA: SBBP repeat-containing protein, partial [Bryobacteraceae bacterium]|nr:SBBP repeat-containing protein [Bryobacteraceae bacterium]
MGLLLAVALGFAVTGFATNPEAPLPSFFIPNAGQAGPSIRYMVQTPDLRAGFGSGFAIFEMHGQALRVRFKGANPRAEVQGEESLDGRANFLIGNRPDAWRTSLPIYRKIRYRNLYPGIDMTYGSAGTRIKSEFLVAPGADPNAIRLEYAGAGDLSLDPNGDLIFRGAQIQLRELAPVVYSEGGSREPVPARYRLLDSHTVGFEIGPYDSSRPLLIDPVLSYATYLGGSGMSAVTGLAVDSSGDLYISGWTEALDSQIMGALQASNKGGVDAFIMKLNATGSGLLYATYIGGRSDDRAAAIAVDGSGQAYVTGSTASSNFPLASPIRSTLGGGRDAFALKLNAAGSALVYSTYLGGSNSDSGTAIAADASGNAYVAGDTLSADFPVLSAAQGAFGGGTDAFVTKLTPAGAISFSTFLGGSTTEHAGGIAVDSSGNVYVGGGTNSSNFPVAGAIQSANGGSQDAFLTKLNSAGSQIVYSTYLGGSGGGVGSPEQINAVAVDASGNAYAAGVTNSYDFPVTAGAFQTIFNGVQDAFISAINSAGNALIYSTYLGGTSFDWASGLAIDASGNAYVAGYTSSADLPSVGAMQASFNGLYDAFVSELSAQGNALAFSTFYGGSGADEANAIAVDSNGNMFVGGQTSSLDLALAGPIQASNNGGSIGWAARFGVTAPPPQLPSAVSVSPSSGSGNTVTFTAQFSDPAGAATIAAAALLLNTTATSSFGCQVSYSPASNQFTLANDDGSPGSTPVNPGGGTAQNSQCTLNGSGSSAAISGSTLTLTVSLSFEPGFGGGKTVYLYAADSGGNTGWVSRGTWTVTVPPPQPTADSVSPNNSTGASDTFTFVFSDTQNALNITAFAMLFNTSVSSANACYIVVDRNAGSIALLWDNAGGSDSKQIGSSALLQNSQCQIGANSVTVSGLSNIISVAITFKGAFSGAKGIYMFGSEGGTITTGWVQKGTYTVAAPGVPVAESAVPSSGSGPGQRFSFTISDQGGSSYLNGMAVLIAPSLDQTNACSLVWDRTAGTVALAFDIPSHGAAQLVPGSNTIVSNSQCTLRGVNTTVIVSATSVVVTMDLTFNATYFGAKNIYLYASEPDANSGWVTVGGWTVTGGAPTADSVSPDSGSGSSP